METEAGALNSTTSWQSFLLEEAGSATGNEESKSRGCVSLPQSLAGSSGGGNSGHAGTRSPS